jgi:Chemotaxis protein histidine kinase and related kinases
MDQEKQRQITIYFIEEAKEHLDTIEHGLLNLKSMLTDPEAVNEVFRAAHSIKGGAAMLGLHWYSEFSAQLRGQFQIFREHQDIRVDQQLQTYFLEGFDKLKDLITQLESPEGLSQDTADAIVRESAPIFEQIRRHLNSLAGIKSETVPAPKPAATVPPPQAPASKPPVVTTSVPAGDRTLVAAFQVEVPAKLRDMLQCFKQPDSPKNRDTLQGLCDQLKAIGDRFDLTQWSDLLQAMRAVLGRPDLQFRLLAPLAIREIKQAQELVLAGRASAIQISPQLREVMPAGVLVGEELRLQQWQNFLTQLGWVQSTVQYNLNAPEGHLPAPIWFEPWQDSEPSRMRSLYETFLDKLADCEIG